jgi:peptidoglycan/xylan/chitin deacetylase (PgdA/CDA1 family)
MPVLLLLTLFCLALVACAPGSNETPTGPAPIASVATPSLLPMVTPTTTPTATRSPSPLPTAFITPPAAGGFALVPILMYHHLADLASNATPLDHTWTVSPSNFEAQMSWLAGKGFHTISFPQLVAFLKHGQPLPARPVIITFDDGWAEGYSVAFRTLVKHNLVGTFFVYTNAIDHRQFMTWAQLQEMSTAGMDIGSHTLSHPHLRSLTPDAAYKEIADSRALLEKRLNRQVTTFDYPFGEYDSATVDLVKRAGFESAVTISPGYKQRAEEILTLHRIRVTYEITLEEFSKLLP